MPKNLIKLLLRKKIELDFCIAHAFLNFPLCKCFFLCAVSDDALHLGSKLFDIQKHYKKSKNFYQTMLGGSRVPINIKKTYACFDQLKVDLAPIKVKIENNTS